MENIKKRQSLKLFVQASMLVASSLVFSSCDRSNNPDPVDENELITTVSLRFTEQGTSTVQTFTYRDTDGDGGQAPTKFDAITLKAGKTYDLVIDFLDESKTPVDNITTEIKEKQDEHLIVYTPSPTMLLTVTATDKDNRNFPVGLTATAKTGTAGVGTLKVQLRHQPPINGQAVKNGTVTPGSDDVNLDFTLTVN
jgi:hypothetical protein